MTNRRTAGVFAALLFTVAALAVHPGVTPAAPRWNGSFAKHTLPAAAAYPTRDYWLYRPSTLPVAGQRALVVYLHGCAQTGDDAARSVPWNDLADRRGFIVVYPEQRVPAAGEVDGSAARCWNSGQAALPRGQGELESVAQITRTVAATEGVDARRVYVIGVSSGALMSNAMAATYPDIYSGVGSVEGCSYLCSDPSGDQAYQRMGSFARVMRAFVVQGTADYLTNPAMGELTVSQWVGTNDLADDGMHNMSISPVPSSTEPHDTGSLNRVGSGSGDACLRDFPRNPCPLAAAGVALYPSIVRQYADRGGHIVVESWLVHGLSHNYPGGTYEGSFADPYGPDITTAAFDFFEQGR